jgi:hypothetical protein
VFSFVGAHTVTEVNKNDYDNCAVASNSISSTSTSPATLDLAAAGMHYYICTISGHCAGGMKLAINVGSGSGSGSGDDELLAGDGRQATSSGADADRRMSFTEHRSSSEGAASHAGGGGDGDCSSSAVNSDTIRARSNSPRYAHKIW